MSRFEVICGLAETLLPTIESNSADSLVTDPPSGIGFMGQEWDKNKGGRDKWIAWLASIMEETHRVLKPGAYGLVWALPRTSHWTGMALEDAGFEVRDRVSHLFASGFPKSMDVSKAFDKAAGAERETERIAGEGNALMRHGGDNTRPWMEAALEAGYHERPGAVPVTDLAREWDGWGTALKPAMEDWWLIQKPFKGTICANIERHGVGALNIDACRIPVGSSDPNHARNGKKNGRTRPGYDSGLQLLENKTALGEAGGRWPANFIHDGSDEVLAEFAQYGEKKLGGRNITRRKETNGYEGGWGNGEGQFPDDTGNAARFFYAAKPSQGERSFGLEGERNAHPTVKSFALMRYLCRLITPKSGLILDPFTGSGTTGAAAMMEGFRFWGCEADEGHATTAFRRIRSAANQDGLFGEGTP